MKVIPFETRMTTAQRTRTLERIARKLASRLSTYEMYYCVRTRSNESDIAARARLVALAALGVRRAQRILPYLGPHEAAAIRMGIKVASKVRP